MAAADTVAEIELQNAVWVHVSINRDEWSVVHTFLSDGTFKDSPLERSSCFKYVNPHQYHFFLETIFLHARYYYIG